MSLLRDCDSAQLKENLVNAPTRPLAVVTGASLSICRELAKCCAKGGYHLILAASNPMAHDDICELESHGAHVDVVQADFATTHGMDCLYASVAGRRVDALLVNAGQGRIALAPSLPKFAVCLPSRA